MKRKGDEWRDLQREILKILGDGTAVSETERTVHIMNEIVNELAAGTRHFRKSTGTPIQDVHSILAALLNKDLAVEFHCISCGRKINGITHVSQIDRRLCRTCAVILPRILGG